MNPTTLAQYYEQQGAKLPSVSERRTLANQFGIQNYSGTAQQNQQLLSNLVSITPDASYTPTSSNPVNLSTIPEGVPTPPASTVVPTTSTQPTLNLNTNNAVSVVRTVDNADGTTTNYLSDGSTDTGTYTKNDDGSLTFNPSGSTSKDPLVSRQETLQNEITALEKSIANRGADRNAMLESVEGTNVFDQMRNLNTLKSQLKTATDEATAIPIRTRQSLRGTGATTQDFTNVSTPQLEDNLLQQLTSSRQVESLTQSINTNIAIVDSYLKAKQDQEDFVYAQKQKELENVQKIYGNIITSQQALALEERKQANTLEIENLKFKNDSLTKAADAALKAGADPSAVSRAVQNGSVGDLYGLAGNATNKTTASSKEGANVNLVSSVDLINRMLQNEGGLGANVGTTQVGRGIRGSATSLGNINAFRADFQKLVADETLRTFLELKGQGATFGAMTESEWALLERAALDLGSIQGKEGRSNLTPETFKERLTTVQNGIKKLFIANNLSEQDYNNSGLRYSQNSDEINRLYNATLADKSTAKQSTNFLDELSGAPISSNTSVVNTIAQNEGFRPQAYQDSAGVWTIGYGATQVDGRPVRAGDTISQSKAQELLNSDIARHSTYANLVNKQLTPGQQAGLASFEYNLGSGVWNQPAGQRIIAAINSNDLNTAANIMQAFVNARNPKTGQLEPVQGLVNRRQREAQLLFA